MDVSMEGPATASEQDDSYLITDADMAVFNTQFSYFPREFDRFRKSIFHKYFLTSIEKVKEDKSRHGLLLRLHQQLDTGIYHFPISDLDQLYKCIFETLPKLEMFQNDPGIMDELFLIMNVFMFRFYDIAFPFFYNFTTEGNIFTYGPIFVINYFRQFSIRFYNKSVASDQPYLKLLEQDGSLTNILNYLFDQYTKGVELPLLSECITRLMRWINCHFLRDYLTQKNFFKTGTSIFVNSNIKVTLRMDFPIAFYMNYFENHYEKASTPFLKLADHTKKFTYEEELSKKEAMAQEIIDDINDLKVKNYLETYLSSYVDQLIMEGRLLNTVNPLGSSQDSGLNSSMAFYPPKAEDEYINYLFDLLLFMFRFIEQGELPDEIYANYLNCIFDFIPIIVTIYKVIPGVFLSDWIKWTNILFNISRESNSNIYEILRDAFLEIIQMRISGDFLLNLECREMLKMLTIEFEKLSGPKEITRAINQTSISSYTQILFSKPNPEKDPFVDEDLFFSTIKFLSLDSTIEWFDTVIKWIKLDDIKPIISRATITYLGNISTEPDFIECVLDLFQSAKFKDDDYKDLNEKGIIPYFFKLFIEAPDLQSSIMPTKFFDFCDSIGKYIIDNDALIEETFSIVIETNDLFRIKLFSIVLNYGSKDKYQSFAKRIADDVISKSMEITPETTNEQIIQQIISVSAFLTTIKFNGNESIFNILKASLDYLNKLDESQQNIMNIEEYHDESHLKFDPLMQSKVNIVYALTNSFGFAAVDDFLGLINYFLTEDYGMCIEVLNVISNIVGFLVDYLGGENILSEILTTNETIFKIMDILIANTPENSINFNLQQYLEMQDQIQQSEATIKNPENMENRGSFADKDEEERAKEIYRQHRIRFDKIKYEHSIHKSKKKYSKQIQEFKGPSPILKFALYPLGYETKTSSKIQRFGDRWHRFQRPDEFPEIYRKFNEEEEIREEQEEKVPEQIPIINSCLYSYRMEGQKVDDTFGYALKGHLNYKSEFRYQSVFTVNMFIRNFTNYVINMLKIFGIKPETISLFKKIIMIAIKNGLIQVPALDAFLHFVADNPDFFTNDEEVSYWISGLVERSSFLMISSRPSEKDESAKLEIGDKKEQLKLIFLFFYNMNQSIFPGCLTEELINVMFKYSPFSQESFLNFINSEEADMDLKLNEFLGH